MAKKVKKKAKKTKAKAKARKPAKKKVAKEMLLVASKVKQALRDQGVNVASDAVPACNEVIYWFVEQAAKRAAANGRKTVRPHDFML